MVARLTLALFDVDGTLVDSQSQIAASMRAAFGAVDLLAPAHAAVLSIIGLSLPLAMRALAPGASDGQIAKLTGAYREAFIKLRQDGAVPPLYPGAAELLARLAARDTVFLGIATGKARRGLDHVLAAHGLDGVFHTAQVADDHPSKPHPSMALQALAETGVEPRDCVMIGDTSFDMEMGRAAGVRAVGVGWGYHAAEALLRAGAETIVDDFAALGAALEQIWMRETR
ncbi:MAG: HAD-IA family hydrolase [Alphaproteobacteria bacterium]|nr:HAD-IA family hydrolase [Alphaproteobacteria bacterium]